MGRPKKSCEVCGITLSHRSISGLCLKHRNERPRLLREGKLRPTFKTKVTVKEIDGKRVIVG